MKKCLLIIACLMILTGCSVASSDNLNEKIETVLNEESSLDNIRQNNSLPYFTFYLPSDMNISDCDRDGCVIYYDKSKILLNINVASIINNKYYATHTLDDEKIFDDNKLILEKKDKYLNDEDTTKNYIFKLYDYDKYYQMSFVSDDVVIYAYAYLNNLVETVRHVMLLARCVRVKTSEVITNYSNKEVIDYQKKQINLFEYIIPSEGKISDLVIDDTNADATDN